MRRGQGKDEPQELKRTQAVVVYDSNDGSVVHVHAFVPADPGDEMPIKELHEAAMEMASRYSGRESLAIAEVPKDLVREERRPLMVDVETGEVRSAPARAEASLQRRKDG